MTMKKSKLFLVFLLVTIPLIPSVFANENLYVSKDIAEKNFIENYGLDVDNDRSFIDGCTSFAPKNYHRVTTYRYFDQLSPTFDVGFLKNEYPITIDSTTFEKSEFLEPSKTVTIQSDQPVVMKILLFENRGPQNIQNVTLYADLQNNFLLETMPSISLNKDPPKPVSDPIQYYIKGQIEEDFGQSYRGGNHWASYSLNVKDPENIFGNVTASFSKQNNKLETIFEFIFLKPISKSNIILESSDVKGNKMTCYIVDAWQSNIYENFPFLFEKLTLWNIEGKISDSELKAAVKYLNHLSHASSNDLANP